MKQLFLKLNYWLIVPAILLFTLGSLTLYSISPQRLETQLTAFIVGCAAFFFFTIIDYKLFNYFAKYLYIGGLALLVGTEVYGQLVYGSVRWLNIAGVSFQPSEIAKLTIIISVSALISRSSAFLASLKGLVIVCVLTGTYVFFIALQPDLGTSLIVLFAVTGILFAANLNKLYFLVGGSLVGVLSNPLWTSLHDYQQKRILVFLNPLLDTRGAGYNVIQSKIAVGAGQLYGSGIGRGIQSHLQYLPAYWTDFIFASFAEEWGFVGVVILLSLFFIFLASLLFTAFKADNGFGYLLTIGIFVVFFAQFFINIGMNLGIMPVTGIPLPFVSYGGTSLVVSMAMLGIIQSVWVHRKI